MEKKEGIAITHELCPVCTKEMEGSLFINKKLTEKSAEEVEQMTGDITWSKTFCNTCTDMKSKGFILIGAVEAKTTDVTNPYRSGNVWCVEQQVAEELFSPHGAPKSGVAFVDVTVAAQIQLPGVNLDA
jgi:hypothetical protein